MPNDVFYTAKHKPTGETLTRYGYPLVATREQWAELGPRLVGELTPWGTVGDTVGQFISLTEPPLEVRPLIVWPVGVGILDQTRPPSA